MRSRLRAIGYGCARAAGGLRRQWSTAAIATGAIGSALLLVATVHLVARNVRTFTETWGGGVQMVVYLDEGISRDRAAAIAVSLDAVPAVERIDYVSPQLAHERLAQSLGTDSDLLQGIEVGMLPASLELTLRRGVSDVAAIHPIAERLTATAGVESVEFLDDWVARLSALLEGLRMVALVLALVVAFACVFIIGSTMRLGLRARAEEMRVMLQVGASPGFVRGPLLLEGVVIGAAGATAAAVALWFVYAAGADRLQAAVTSAFGAVPVEFLPASEVASLIAVGAALGLVGSWIALPRSDAAV